MSHSRGRVRSSVSVHPNVVTLYGVALSPGSAYLVTEFIPDGSLDSHLKAPLHFAFPPLFHVRLISRVVVVVVVVCRVRSPTSTEYIPRCCCGCAGTLPQEWCVWPPLVPFTPHRSVAHSCRLPRHRTTSTRIA